MALSPVSCQQSTGGFGCVLVRYRIEDGRQLIKTGPIHLIIYMQLPTSTTIHVPTLLRYRCLILGIFGLVGDILNPPRRGCDVVRALPLLGYSAFKPPEQGKPRRDPADPLMNVFLNRSPQPLVRCKIIAGSYLTRRGSVVSPNFEYGLNWAAGFMVNQREEPTARYSCFLDRSKTGHAGRISYLWALSSLDSSGNFARIILKDIRDSGCRLTYEV
ncbi:uncharacterized protein BO80DRAFT_236351 [Aspergillus ibericus CBS 121593]|uniref:Uncharacterized protein n=1 Tax=Aspergillus ibericus CBS 121593 TaxID=1448316 RepID=A0A395HBB1_9EURO|nr:hypothetical protein BO80DRAFT_236351 [Aspergillus ibericus CBS 121593]RAL04415.1 hypothetical protein BO80DRAFT_236351 [Aspergillus ibericus CBS 121593]